MGRENTRSSPPPPAPLPPPLPQPQPQLQPQPQPQSQPQPPEVGDALMSTADIDHAFSLALGAEGLENAARPTRQELLTLPSIKSSHNGVPLGKPLVFGKLQAEVEKHQLKADLKQIVSCISADSDLDLGQMAQTVQLQGKRKSAYTCFAEETRGKLNKLQRGWIGENSLSAGDIEREIGIRWKARSDEVKQVYEQPKVYPHIAGQVGTARPDKRQRGSNPEYSRKAGAGGERLERLEFKASGAASAQTEQPSVPALPRKNRILIVGKTAPAGKKWDARNKKFKVNDTPRPGAYRAGSSPLVGERRPRLDGGEPARRCGVHVEAADDAT